jgi:5-methyltetrahydrofolate--homocysteine methyltransferase
MAGFLDKLHAGEALASDGATGTNLQERGLPLGMPSDLWVLENPQQIIALHRDFIAAGSQVILTASFGGTTVRLKGVGLAERAEEINRSAVALAKKAAAGTGVFIGGSMGPLGELLKPLGTLEAAEASAAYAAQAKALSAAGVDLLVIETQYDLAEAGLAVKAARAACNLPIVVSFSYDRGKRTMMGVRPTQMAAEMAALGVDVLGINCGRSLTENLQNLQELRAATKLPIWFKPNAGLPVVGADGNPTYDVTPEVMGAAAAEWLKAGAQVVGGCCGTTPQHLKAIGLAVSN